ncbi:MAG TPA: hypothetical protein VGQ83_33420 [Polyangia bacterium]|jgi:hypothetical protein
MQVMAGLSGVVVAGSPVRHVRAWAERLRRIALGATVVFLLVAPGIACDGAARPPTRPGGSPGQKIVNEYVGAAGSDFKECHDFGCLEQAGASGCVPARLHLAQFTVEGQPAFGDCFVRPSLPGGSCDVVVIMDHSFDYWAGCGVYRQRCSSIRDARRMLEGHVPCGDGEVVYKARSCKPPLRNRISSFFHDIIHGK